MMDQLIPQTKHPISIYVQLVCIRNKMNTLLEVGATTVSYVL
jgi:hypothetical protein